MAAIGLQGQVADHASYIDNWLSVLKNDKRAVFKAAAQAEIACQWLLSQLDKTSAQTSSDPRRRDAGRGVGAGRKPASLTPSRSS